MRQQTLAEEGFEKYRKPTRREQFLDEMDRIIPWAELSAVIEPFYPKGEGRGRPPVGVERMLRIHFLQHWFNLSDPAVEEALYDSRAMRRFVGIDLGREPVPDETTICKFRHLLERHNLGDRLFALIAEYLQENGLKVATGTIVDATIINAPSSTKNKDRQRDPEMHQTKKGNQWCVGTKGHFGYCLPDLLHGEETAVWGPIRPISERRWRATSPIGVTVTRAWSMRLNGRRTGRRPRCGHESSIRSASSSEYSASRRCATGAGDNATDCS